MKYLDCKFFLRNFIKNYKNLNFNRKKHRFKKKIASTRKNKQLSVKKIIIKIALTESPALVKKNKKKPAYCFKCIDYKKGSQF